MAAASACVSPWPASQRRRGACRRSLVVRAARQGRGGRFPATPHVSTHPLPLADVCDAWRSGRTPVDVVSSWLSLPTRDRGALFPLEAQFNAENVASDWRRALLAPPLPETLGVATFPQARLLLTTVQPELEAAIALEASLASPGALPLGDGVFVAPLPSPPSRLVRMLSLRAEIDPLASGASSTEIIAAVQSLDWDALDRFCVAEAGGGSSSRPEWRLHHERVRYQLVGFAQ